MCFFVRTITNNGNERCLLVSVQLHSFDVIRCYADCLQPNNLCNTKIDNFFIKICLQIMATKAATEEVEEEVEEEEHRQPIFPFPHQTSAKGQISQVNNRITLDLRRATGAHQINHETQEAKTVLDLIVSKTVLHMAASIATIKAVVAPVAVAVVSEPINVSHFLVVISYNAEMCPLP